VRGEHVDGDVEQLAAAASRWEAFGHGRSVEVKPRWVEDR